MNRNLVKPLKVSAAAAGITLLGLLGWLMAKNPKLAIAKCSSQEVSCGGESISVFARPVNPKLTTANTKFGFKLFSEIRKQESNKNIFVSPGSVAIALAMTYNGASGETQQQMAKALELQGMSLEEINQANDALRSNLANPDAGVQLSIANSLWARKGVPFKQKFINRNLQFYQAKVTDLNFYDPGSADIINNWVKENTRGKIERIIDNLKYDDVLFLINAIYFKGKWTNEFDKSQTANYPFTRLDGTQKQHPMMSQTGKYSYYENNTFQAVSLPYGKERLSLYIFQPKQNTSLDAFYKQMNTQNWEQWISQFRMRDGSIRVPRFKLEYDIELSSALKALGMESAFDPYTANFTEMSSIPVNIDQVKHKTFVEVNEEGTEAAAVTSVNIVTTSARIPEEPFRMVVDRPFFCAIRDNQTGTVLFMGSIVEPN
ncbi:MAG: serpin family protein [Aphanothece sp. CMT-3BRIN-NPC111]|nr:serpin family protein [Aphanothece sp. CMT-3BRIN-NPC111]